MTKKETFMNRDEKLARLIETASVWKMIAESKKDGKVIIDMYDIESLIGMLEDVQMKCGDFIDDDEKMADFHTMSKEAFLESYSYLTEDEYENTKTLYDAYWGPFYRRRFEELSEQYQKLKNVIQRMHTTTVRLGNSVYKDIDLNSDDYVYLFTVQEAYGDGSYYQDKKTGELYYEYFSIGD